jgi:hypothetical protein
MKTETIKQAIDFVLGDPAVQSHIATLEAQPNRFVIYQIVAEVRDLHASIIRVVINFYESARPDFYKEDIIVELQGTTYRNFIIRKINQAQL